MDRSKRPKIIYISWAQNCSRSDHTARELGGTSYMIYWGRLGSNPLTIWLKYLGQSFSTLRLLFRERPDVVFVMSPPVIAVLAVFLYCSLRKIRYVIDSHSAAFLMPRWRHFQGLQRWLERRAATTLVHNDYLAEIVRRGGGHATVVPDVPIRYETHDAFELNGHFSVAAVCSFNYDEPIAEIIEAARQLPEVRFYFTGDPKFLDPALRDNLPSNVVLTGFLSNAAYGSLIRKADVVMTLTTRDHTMLRAAYEAIYQGTPVIISDWPLLRRAFDSGAVHVRNVAADIVRAVREIQSYPDQFREGAKRLCQHKLAVWQKTRNTIMERIRQ